MLLLWTPAHAETEVKTLWVTVAPALAWAWLDWPARAHLEVRNAQRKAGLASWAEPGGAALAAPVDLIGTEGGEEDVCDVHLSLNSVGETLFCGCCSKPAKLHRTGTLNLPTSVPNPTKDQKSKRLIAEAVCMCMKYSWQLQWTLPTSRRACSLHRHSRHCPGLRRLLVGAAHALHLWLPSRHQHA